jgi:hypothetical protein
MQIPKQVTVNTTRYAVESVQQISGKRRGYIHYDDKYIKVATHNPVTGKPRSERQQAQTFWHEMTHAILRDMGHRLASNEEFVDAFATRLNDAIYSAKF